MEKVYIFGHKKPDTDTVCGAIALSYLKDKMGFNTEPRILSEINSETAFALKRFNIPVPRYLNDVKVKLKDVKYKRNWYIDEETSIYDAYLNLRKKEITGVPLVGPGKKYTGYIATKELNKALIVNETSEINTSFTNLIMTLNATESYKFDKRIVGKLTMVMSPYRIFISTAELDSASIVITANHESLIGHAINKQVKLIIVIDGSQVSKDLIKLAKEKKVNLIITPYDAFKVARIIVLANPVKTIKREEGANTFTPSDYFSDFLEATSKLKHTNYPIVNSKGICEGMLRVIDAGDVVRKKVILVDHNDPEQSVDGLLEADILEIVDHHNISNFNTNSPINFRNMSVGAVNTIIYYLFIEQNVRIPKHIAGIMLSGILSDTLLLESPTATQLDKIVAKSLAKIANVDLKTYGLELLKSGVSIVGLTPNDVINKDFKSYSVGEHRIGIAQVFTTSFNEYAPKINDYVACLNEMSDKSNYIVVCLFVTDFINNNSYLLFNESAKTYLEDAYNISNITQGYLLPGIVSRKKQMIPLIMEAVEKK